MQDHSQVQQASASGAPKGLGIAAIICGGVGLCVPGLAMVGLVLGVVGLAMVKPGGKQLPGIGAGVSGGALVLNLLLMIALLLPALGAARSAARMIEQQQQLREIGTAYTAYAIDHKGDYPDHAEDVLNYAGGTTDVFVAPGDDPATLPMTKPSAKPTKPYAYGSYEFMPLGGISFESPSTLIIAYSKPTGPDDRFIVAVFVDGSSDAFELAEFERMKQETLAWLEPYIDTNQE